MAWAYINITQGGFDGSDCEFQADGCECTTRIHRSEVECGWAMFTSGGRSYLQLDTYGSSSRVNPGKVSQTIQLDEEGARELKRLLSQAFPSLD